MFYEIIEKAIITILTIFALLLVLLLFIGLAETSSGNSISEDIEATTAEPIYQQQIGDEADPDILIIYEAEVDGVKVYPSVIKEAE